MIAQSSGQNCRTAVLISGSGTNLQAFIDSVDNGQLTLDLVLVLSNKASAYGLQRAAAANIDTVCVTHRDFETREAFDRAMAAELNSAAVDLVILAGFMRILSPWFVTAFSGRILNIHPALLPSYPGLHTYERVIEAGDAWHGSTVHFVTEELDGGPRVLAGRLPVHKGETASELQARVQTIEHQIYPQAAAWFADGRLVCRDGAAWLDGQRLDQPVVQDFE